MTPPWRLRVYFTVVAIGFAMSAWSSAAGSGPTWPNRVTFAALASFAALSTVGFVICWRPFERRLMVASAVLAATSRALGWLLTTDRPIEFRIGGVGALLVVAAEALIINNATRRGL